MSEVPKPISVLLREWRSNRMQKTMAAILQVSIWTYDSWERSKREPKYPTKVGILKIMQDNPNPEEP